jgi:hypothetical protein
MWISFWLLSAVTSVISIVFGTWLIARIAVHGWSQDPSKLLDPAFLSPFAIAGAGSIIAPLLCGMCKSFFGRELLVGMLESEMVTQSCPDTMSEGMALATLKKTVRGFSHSIYREPEVTVQIAKWLSRGSLEPETLEKRSDRQKNRKSRQNLVTRRS